MPRGVKQTGPNQTETPPKAITPAARATSGPNADAHTDGGLNPARRWDGRRMPKLRHHKHTGRSAVTIAGRDIYLGRWGSDEAEAAYHRVLAEYKSTGRVGPIARYSAFVPSMDRSIPRSLIYDR